MLRKLGSYPRQNGLAVALRELGRIDRTLFILDWLQSVASTDSAIRDRSFEQQRYRASGLNLVTAAIVLWNTVYLERATSGLCGNGEPPGGALLPFLSPLGWGSTST